MGVGTLFDACILDRSPGFISFTLEGSIDALLRLKRENGGHQWQRIPPTERSGRVQTSIVTVYVNEMSTAVEPPDLKMSELEIRYTTAGGNGGQHQNKTLSACHIKHIPTGIEAVSRSERHQPQNRRLALQVLDARLKRRYNDNMQTATNNVRKEQIGSGGRGDKIRTYRVKDDLVLDHMSGSKLKLSRFIKGEL